MNCSTTWRRTIFAAACASVRATVHTLAQKTLPVILDHARGFIGERLAPAEPRNDGRQTPWNGHPVFVAQHGTATCCRKCLAKWHEIERGKPLSSEEVEYIVGVIERWLRREQG